MSYSVLVIEDERPVSQVLELKLNRSGIHVTTAYDGHEAIKKFKESEFNLILLDLMMPEMDGFDVLRHIRKGDTKTPIFVTTNLSQDEDKEKAKSLGANKYIVKSDTLLADIVKDVLETLETEPVIPATCPSKLSSKKQKVGVS